VDLRASFERQLLPELSQNASFKLVFWGVVASGPSYSLWKPKSLYGLNLGFSDPLPGWLVHLFLLLEGYRVGPIFLIGNISINNNNCNGKSLELRIYFFVVVNMMTTGYLHG
jgi:hypothetical protein